MNEPKSRITMRVSEDNRALTKEAAEANSQDMTSFVVGAALEDDLAGARSADRLTEST